MKNPRRPDPRVLVTAAAVVLIACASLFAWFSNQEAFFYDLRFRLRPPEPVSSDIVIIEISDDTLTNLGHWPLPRDFHASLLDVLRALGARAVVFDLLLSEPSPHDAVLAEAMAANGNVYLPKAFYLDDVPGRPAPFPQSRMVLGGIVPALESAIKGSGHINVVVDGDGKIRRVPLFILTPGGAVANLGLRAACDSRGLPLAQSPVFPDHVLLGGRLRVPLGPGGVMYVNYPGPWRTTFQRVSYFDLLKSYMVASEGGVPKLDLSFFRDKICFVGLTATGTSDLRANPFENVYPMVGLQASVANSVLTGRFLGAVAPWGNVAAALAVLLLCLLVNRVFLPLTAFGLNVVLAAAVFWGGQLLFEHARLYADVFLPLLVIVVTYGVCLFERFVAESRRRQLMEKELEIARKIQAQFLPRGVVSCAGLDVEALMEPAKYVAGDLYDIVRLGDAKIGVFVGDVSGKGVPAALIMAQTVSLFRVFARTYEAPHDVLTALNRELADILDGRFVTAVYLVIDGGARSVRVASAGHPPMLVASAGRGAEERATVSGPPLGVMKGSAYGEDIRTLAAGDRVFLYTDGITEARNGAGEEYGLERLRAVLAELAGRPPDALLKELSARLGRFQGAGNQFDDITAVVVDFKQG
ncbi:MAG: SpoIIE family protein phosphatase [Deltaproteobacteria bacterium]